MEQDVIQKVKIGSLNFQDSFFDSLREDYGGSAFEEWLVRKSDEFAYVFFENNTSLSGFLYLKDEYEEDDEIVPHFEYKRRLKIGTFKINSHGTVLGQRFLGIVLRQMLEYGHDFVYVTLFEKQNGLIKLFEKFGFVLWGEKNNGELIFYKNLDVHNNIYTDFPRINITQDNRKHLLGILPTYHTKLFPESILNTEKNHIIEDLSFTNTSEKVYLTAMRGVRNFNSGDLIAIYRTKENGKSAEYSSVVTSICTVVEVVDINDFETINDFISYCGKGTIFSRNELIYFWNNKNYPYIIKMLYNVPLKKRIIRKKLIEDIGLNRSDYFGCMLLTDTQFEKIIEIGEINESFIIN